MRWHDHIRHFRKMTVHLLLNHGLRTGQRRAAARGNERPWPAGLSAAIPAPRRGGARRARSLL